MKVEKIDMARKTGHGKCKNRKAVGSNVMKKNCDMVSDAPNMIDLPHALVT